MNWEDEVQTPTNMPSEPIPGRVDPSDMIKETPATPISMTEPRLPLNGEDSEVNDPSPPLTDSEILHQMRELLWDWLSFAGHQAREQQHEAERVLKLLVTMGDPWRQQQNVERNDGDTGRSRPTRGAQTGRDETEGRRPPADSRNGAVPRRAHRDEIQNRIGPRSNRPLDGAPKTEKLRQNGGFSTTDSEFQRFQPPTGRRAEQARGAAPGGGLGWCPLPRSAAVAGLPPGGLPDSLRGHRAPPCR